MVTERTMATMPRPQHKACISFGFLSHVQVIIVQSGSTTSTLIGEFICLVSHIVSRIANWQHRVFELRTNKVKASKTNKYWLGIRAFTGCGYL